MLQVNQIILLHINPHQLHSRFIDIIYCSRYSDNNYCEKKLPAPTPPPIRPPGPPAVRPPGGGGGRGGPPSPPGAIDELNLPQPPAPEPVPEREILPESAVNTVRNVSLIPSSISSYPSI